MGNCCRRESSTEWGGEEWGSPLPQKLLAAKRNACSPERECLLAPDEKDASSSTTTTTTTTEVKIKITKKQLEELLGKVDVQGLSVEHLLKHLINARDDYQAEQQHHHHHGGWKPALQSIPEVD